MIIICRITLNEEQCIYLISLLNEKYYSITDLGELAQINQIYKQLKFKSESWLSAIQTKKTNKK